MEPVTAGIGLGNGAYLALERGTKGVKAGVRKLRLAGIIDIEWLNLEGSTGLTAQQLADVERFLGSDTVRPLLSMSVFAKLDPSSANGLLSSLANSFESEARRWNIQHEGQKDWTSATQSIWNRVLQIYETTLPQRLDSPEYQEELSSYTNFVSTPLGEASDASMALQNYMQRLSDFAGNFERVTALSRTTTALTVAIAGAVRGQAISSLPQADVFASFDELYVGRSFVEIDSGADVPSAVFTTGGFPFRAMLLGSPGAGKSTFCSHLVMTSVNPEGREVTIPCIEVRCRDYARLAWDKGIVEFIGQLLRAELSVDLPSQALEDVILTGRVMILFDGLDEVTDRARRADLVRRLHSFAVRYPAVSILATSREVGYERAPVDSTIFKHVRLNDFSGEEIIDYSQRWFSLVSRPDLVDSFISESDSIEDIRSNPLMLSLLCMLYREPGAIPLNRRGIYAQCANELFHRWDLHRQIQQNESMPRYGDRLMQEIARWFLTTPSTSGGLDEQVLTKVVTLFMVDSLGFDPSDASVSARDFMDFCAGRAWLLARVGTTSNGTRVFNFTHRTFYEYFAADAFARSVESPAHLASEIHSRYLADATSVLPELMIQAYDEYRERGGALVFDVLCRRRASAGLLLRLMEGTILLPHVRKKAFDLTIQAFADGDLNAEAIQSLFSVTAGARKQLIDTYLREPEQPISRIMLLEAWAALQMTGRWTGRTVADWADTIDDLVDTFFASESDEWTSTLIANWLVTRGWELDLRARPTLSFLVCASPFGPVPGALWWAIDALMQHRSELTGLLSVHTLLAALKDDLQAGQIPRAIIEQLGSALSGQGIEHVVWHLSGEFNPTSKSAYESLVMITLALSEVDSPAYRFLATSLARSGLPIEEIVTMRHTRRNDIADAGSAGTALAPLPHSCTRWARGQFAFVE